MDYIIYVLDTRFIYFKLKLYYQELLKIMILISVGAIYHLSEGYL